VAIVGGIVIFLTQLISAVTVGIVIGAYWVAGGIVGIVGAIIVPGNRLVRLLVAGCRCWLASSCLHNRACRWSLSSGSPARGCWPGGL
jgi:hypothetical protein